MLSKKNDLLAKFMFIAVILVGSFAMLSLITQTGNIMGILAACGVHVSKGFAMALSSISTVYGVQQTIIGALGFAVPGWAAAAVAATTAASF